MNLLDAAKAAVEFLRNGNFVYPTKLATDLDAAIASAEKVEPWGWALPADRDYTIRQVSRIEPSPSGIATPLYTAPPADVVREFTDEDLTRIYNEANGIAGGKNPPITTQRIFAAMRAMKERA